LAIVVTREGSALHRCSSQTIGAIGQQASSDKQCRLLQACQGSDKRLRLSVADQPPNHKPSQSAPTMNSARLSPIVTIRHNSTLVLQYICTIVCQYYSTFVLQYVCTRVHQHYSMSVLQYSSTRVGLYHSTPVLQYVSAIENDSHYHMRLCA
jgi:hypothetical protein